MKNKQPTVCKIALAAFFLFSCQLSSQTLISSSGNSHSNDKIQMDWSLGEAVIASVETSQGYLTQGFHQPKLQIRELENIATSIGELIEFAIWPNPTVSQIQIRSKNSQMGNLTMVLTDETGRIIKSEKHIKGLVSVLWDLSPLPSGQYLVHISGAGNKTVKTARIIKLSN